jgi:hypothetical protein
MRRVRLSPANEPGADDYIVDVPCDCGICSTCIEAKQMVRARERSEKRVDHLQREVSRRLEREKRDDAKRGNARARKAERRISQGYRKAGRHA